MPKAEGVRGACDGCACSVQHGGATLWRHDACRHEPSRKWSDCLRWSLASLLTEQGGVRGAGSDHRPCVQTSPPAFMGILLGDVVFRSLVVQLDLTHPTVLHHRPPYHRPLQKHPPDSSTALPVLPASRGFSRRSLSEIRIGMLWRMRAGEGGVWVQGRRACRRGRDRVLKTSRSCARMLLVAAASRLRALPWRHPAGAHRRPGPT